MSSQSIAQQSLGIMGKEWIFVALAFSGEVQSIVKNPPSNLPTGPAAKTARDSQND